MILLDTRIHVSIIRGTPHHPPHKKQPTKMVDPETRRSVAAIQAILSSSSLPPPCHDNNKNDDDDDENDQQAEVAAVAAVDDADVLQALACCQDHFIEAVGDALVEAASTAEGLFQVNGAAIETGLLRVGVDMAIIRQAKANLTIQTPPPTRKSAKAKPRNANSPKPTWPSKNDSWRNHERD
jgi:hypothetical protein